MSTRAVVKFNHGEHNVAMVYRHCDGYVNGLGEDLLSFFKHIKQNVSDTRFNDASYLAAKWVVCDAERYAEDCHNKLSFLSVGIVNEVPDDVEYIYTIDCDKMVDGRPYVTVGKMCCKGISEL